jgi:hypothetical protein
LTSKYKEHLEDVLFDQEKALLPATQPLVEEKIAKRKMEKNLRELDLLIDDLYRQKRELERKIRYGNNHENEDKEKAHFVRQCPANGCRGFLSTQWKCGICEQWSCPDCHELKGSTRDCHHKCDPNNIETAKLLAKDSKPCPKCQSLIFKISGCFAKDTPILLWDGSCKMSQDICVGDILVGDDGEKRTVEDLVCGEDDLYEIKQTPICVSNKHKNLEQNKNTSYIVNSKHTLVLKTNRDNINDIDDIKLITIDDYFKLTLDEKKDLYGFKIYRIKSDIGIYEEFILTEFQIQYIQKGIYYGWKVNGNNNRFLLNDFTVVKNCDQMWCTQCHTAFSWKTGNLEKNIHNPHFYEWQRKNGGGTAPRNPGDFECGRQLTHNVVDTIQDLSKKHSDLMVEVKYNTIFLSGKKELRPIHTYIEPITRICYVVRNVIHNNEVELPNFRTNYFNKNQYLRVLYLEKSISEDEFKIAIQRNDKKNRKNNEVVQVLQLANTTVTDIVYRLMDNLEKSYTGKHNIDSFLIEIEEIIKYCNDIFKDIGFTYNSIQYGFDERFKFVRVEKEKRGKKKASAVEEDDEENEDDDTFIKKSADNLPYEYHRWT